MKNDGFTTSFTVAQTPNEVFTAINNVRGWWSGEVTGETSKLGAEFTYRYKDMHKTTQRVTEFVPGKKVVWHVTAAELTFVKDKTEWIGTDIVFEIARKDGKTELHFTGAGCGRIRIDNMGVRMGWEMPWYTMTDSFDADFGVDQWHGHNAFIRDGEKVYRTYFINSRGDEAMGTAWSYLDMTALGRQETWEDSPEGYPQTAPYKWWNWHDNYEAETSIHPLWLDIITDPAGAAIRRREVEGKACNCE